MEYDENNKPLDELSMLKLMIETLNNRQNEQSLTIAELRSQLSDQAKRLDEADHMTSEEFGAQVVTQVMAVMPAIQAEAMKATKRGGRR